MGGGGGYIYLYFDQIVAPSLEFNPKMHTLMQTPGLAKLCNLHKGSIVKTWP